MPSINDTATEATRYPLSWPVGWQRAAFRMSSRFGGGRGPLTIGAGLQRLRGELGRLGASHVIISTNLPLRQDGLPYASASMPKDPGVAVYFKLKGKDRCLACDRYHRLPDNLAALAAHINAIRAIERYGVGTIEQAFAGYVGLPAKGETTGDKAWYIVLDVDPDTATEAGVRDAHRELAKRYHPDKPGGSHEQMLALNKALNEALQQVGR